ncbi:MAG: nucleotide sugar dehydrogenase [Tenericutes bacterium HGW-Tenericutes-2]|jgi:UDP-N-acetyl-D-mannosaminuronic acid dehydrogenase|nr:MAG: nucleotide sugar dehydrogenase [Tenericutes bacterium HGW-Tenericutes-2]
MINIIGLGYIGLPTALAFSAKGIEVVGTDYNVNLVQQLNSGRVTFEEKGLEELYIDAVKNGVQFSVNYQHADIYLIAVPTPYDKISKKIDPSYVINAVTRTLEVCNVDAVIIIESTVSPGTTDSFIRPLVEKFNKKVHLVHAPERIIPGNMVYELAHNSRTIGADSSEIGERVAKIYREITDGEVIITDIKTAEMTKVVENTFRAVNIAFANELAKICRYDNMDVYEIIKICNMHPRVKILNPGPGVGGHCIPVDPWFLVGDYPSLTKVIGEALEINESMPEYVLSRIMSIMKDNGLKDISRVGLYGLTYKENVDDYRESPSLQLLESQEKHLAEPLKAYDPWVKQKITKNQYFDFDTFLNDVDLVVIMVKHDEIKSNISKLEGKIVFDTQNIIKSGRVYKL